MAEFSDLHVRRYAPQPMARKGRFVHNWFSNFEMDGHPVEYLGRATHCLEIAFVAAKNPGDEAFVDAVFGALPGQAKRLGRGTHLREDWNLVNIAAMDNFLRQKWQPGTAIADRLADTQNELVEINDWRDARWGCTLPEWEGRNALGLLLERVRSELMDGHLDFGAPEAQWAEHQDYLVAAMNSMDHGDVVENRSAPGAWNLR